jgi:hypothetical protein
MARMFEDIQACKKHCSKKGALKAVALRLARIEVCQRLVMDPCVRGGLATRDAA